MQARRRQARPCRVAIAVVILAATLVFVFLTGVVPNAFTITATPPPRPLLVAPLRRLRESALAVTSAATDATVLLPDWEVLVLLHPNATAIAGSNATCAFRRGASSSPARAIGRLPSGRLAYTCVMPESERRHHPFHAPRIVATAAAHGSPPHEEEDEVMMEKWSGRLVYESAVVNGGEVLVFAKGVNPRQGVNRPASHLRCLYYRRRGIAASLPAATSAQQVFRCPPPPPTSADDVLRVTLAIAGEDEPIPSVATYNPPPPRGITSSPATSKYKICACTMVRNVGKFLREWVEYHAAVGVDRFILYDNGSDDDLPRHVRHLTADGYHVTTLPWPWPKTQEAGFSHGAAVHRDSCEWMAFIDVDEFIFSPHWADSPPSKSMLQSIVAVKPNIGQVSLRCMDFGPSGRTAHPGEGVTQGYTCRRRSPERHKSLLRLDAADPSLLNCVHHFELRPEFAGEMVRRGARVNHYKYQAWPEFRVKFRRRVSTYVADWTDRVNLQSKDRTPGLGFEPVEPAGWAAKFCQVNDTLLRDVTRRWFGSPPSAISSNLVDHD
uniref:Glycosyltransferase family 92 protein n=1 Tax=Leersia perrieri TaxID=77586 RepID=A0A0D9WUC4_9ORYZ